MNWDNQDKIWDQFFFEATGTEIIETKYETSSFLKLLVSSSVKNVFILFCLNNYSVNKHFFNKTMTGNTSDINPKRKSNSSKNDRYFLHQVIHRNQHLGFQILLVRLTLWKKNLSHDLHQARVDVLSVTRNNYSLTEDQKVLNITESSVEKKDLPTTNYSFPFPDKTQNQRLSRPWNHLVVLNNVSLDLQSSGPTTGILLSQTNTTLL